MKTTNYLIVELEDAYDNEIVLESGYEVIVNSTIESVEHIKRRAIVKASPTFTILNKGDEVIVHHNIFRLRNDQKGNKIESNYYLKDNLYIVPLTEIFMYKRGKGDWTSINPFCFVEPIKKERKEGFDLNASEDSYKGFIEGLGRIRFVNEELSAQGVRDGDKVMFSKWSEYEIIVDGKMFYKMRTKDILYLV